ncbi:MAG: S8 family peptidase [Gemmatimonadales bacterium]
MFRLSPPPPRVVILPLLLWLTVTACFEDDPTQGSLDGKQGQLAPSWAIGSKDGQGAIPMFPELPERYPAIRFEVGGELSDSELLQRINESNGGVIVGIKAVDAPLSRLSGTTSSVSRAEVVEAIGALESRGLRVVRTFASFPAAAGTIDPSAALALRELPFVDYVVESGTYTRGASVGSSALLSQTVDWGMTKIGASDTWTYTSGSGATITVIDYGLDSVHIVSGDGPANSIFNLQCLYASDPPNVTSCYQSSSIHGAHVAGIAAARDNSIGYVGVASDASVNSIRACGPSGCSDAALIGAIDWTTTSSIPRHVVNLSLTRNGAYTPLSIALAASAAAGNVIVGAAGNDHECGGSGVGAGVDCYPARYTSVLSVSGTTSTDGFASNVLCSDLAYHKSNYGSGVDISAPFEATNMSSSGNYWSLCGSSMASPHVAGVAALVWAYNPGFTRSQVIDRLTSTAVDYGSSGRDDYFGHGRVQALLSVLGVLSANITGPSFPTGGLDVWTANVTNGIGTIGYAWERRDACDPSWTPVGSNSSTYSEYTTGGDKFFIRVTVTSAGRITSAIQMVGGFAIC